MSGRASFRVIGASAWIGAGTLTAAVLELFVNKPNWRGSFKTVVANAVAAILGLGVGTQLGVEAEFRRLLKILRKALRYDWLELASFFVPKTIREP